MAVCKGILDDARKIAEDLDINIGDSLIESIATHNEIFLQEILCEASSVCSSSRRKVISRDDVQKAVEARNLSFFSILFR